jgi:transposase-like protein
MEEIKCPKCGGGEWKFRGWYQGPEERLRRRKCKECGYCWTRFHTNYTAVRDLWMGEIERMVREGRSVKEIRERLGLKRTAVHEAVRRVGGGGECWCGKPRYHSGRHRTGRKPKPERKGLGKWAEPDQYGRFKLPNGRWGWMKNVDSKTGITETTSESVV